MSNETSRPLASEWLRAIWEDVFQPGVGVGVGGGGGKGADGLGLGRVGERGDCSCAEGRLGRAWWYPVEEATRAKVHQ